MRSQAIKQADVVLLMFLHHDRFTAAQKLANYRYYEPRTTHESSLSPCTHAILAAELGLEKEAFAYYLRTARLDLDDVNGNTNQGLHTACLAGAWQSIVNGFGGMRQHRDHLSFRPRLPKAWQQLVFQVVYRGRRLRVTVEAQTVAFELTGRPLRIGLGGRRVALKPGRNEFRSK